MAITPGTRLGVFQLADLIGRGGMGEVYRATDTTLGRQIAIKILLDAFATDPERLARFAREAKTLASPNHPDIAATTKADALMDLCEAGRGAHRHAGRAAGAASHDGHIQMVPR